ncbi:MAG: hypothetical protein KGK00_08380 [Paracoccaceae bacterium]|nr:hypothetical protein [Paracoccaceae bacterium]
MALLEWETTALLRGDFATLAACLDLKEALVARLGRTGVKDARALADLKTAAQRNATLLLAAEKGLRAARRRLLDLLRAQRGETYDSAGRLADLGHNPPQFERKA